jgi:hypothetical protein
MTTNHDYHKLLFDRFVVTKRGEMMGQSLRGCSKKVGAETGGVSSSVEASAVVFGGQVINFVLGDRDLGI